MFRVGITRPRPAYPLAISTYHYELGELERGWEWLQTALAEAPPNTIAQACVKHSVRNVQG